MILRVRAWRLLMENKGRYIGIFILIFLGSFTFIAAKGFGDNYEKMVSSFAEVNMQEDVSFSTDTELTNVEELEQESGALIDSYQYYDGMLPSGQELRLLSPSNKVNLPAVTSGEGLNHSGDILLDPFFCANQGYGIGDFIQISSNTFRVAGTMALPHYIYPLKYINDILPPSGFGIGLISKEDFNKYFKGTMVYTARFTDRENRTAQVTQLHGLLGEKGYSLSEWVDAANNKRIRMAWATITGAKTMAVPLPVIMFLLCCIVISIMVWRMVRADGVIIGTLYAQGYRKKELIRHYMMLPLALAAVGGIVGVLLGIPCIKPVVKYMALSYYVVPLQEISISVLDIMIGILMPIAFLGFSCFFVIRSELSKTAGDLMKGDKQKTKVNFLERYIKLDRFSFQTKFQLREQLRSIPRLLFLLLGVTAASVMILFGFTISHSMNVVFESNTDGIFNYAWEYSFKKIQTGEVPEGAEPFNAFRGYPEGRESAEIYVTGILPDAAGITFHDADKKEISKDQVNITYLLAKRLKLQEGDTITVINKLNGKSYSLVIDGVIQTYSGQFLYLPLDQFNQMTGQTAGSYSGVFSTRELSYDDELLSGVKDLQNLSSAMGDIAMPMTLVVVFMTLIAGVMGSIIIFLVTSLMIEESRGTISLLKIFGYQGKTVSKLILSSSTWVVIVGFLLAIPLMLVSADAMYSYLGEMINMVLPMILRPLYVLVSFLVIFLVYQITKRFCGRKLEKISMSEALKSGAE